MLHPWGFIRALSSCFLSWVTVTAAIGATGAPLGGAPRAEFHRPQQAPKPRQLPFLAAPELTPGDSYFARVPALDPATERLVTEATAAITAGRPVQAEQLLSRALVSLSARTEPQSRAQALLLLGLSLRQESRWTEAEQRFRQALALFERSRGINNVPAALCLREVSRALLNENRPTEAEVPARRALSLLTAALGENHPETLESLDVLGSVLLATDRSPEAENSLRTVVHSAELSILIPAYLHGRLLSRLGTALVDEQRYSEAVTELEAAVAQLDSVSPAPNYDLAATLYWLARSFNALHKAAQGERSIRRVLHLLDTFPHSDLDAGDSEQTLGDALYDQAKYGEAADAFSKALRLRTRALGSGDLLVADSLVMYGTALCRADRCAEGEVQLRKALALQERVESNSVSTSDTAEKLGLVLFRQHKYGEAERSYARSLAIRYEVSGPIDPHTVHAQIDVAFAQYEQNKITEARDSFTQALEAQARAHRAPDDFIALAEEQLGEILDSQGDAAGAARCFQRALKIHVQLQSLTDNAVIASFYVAFTAFEQDNLDLALQELTQLYAYHQRLNTVSSGSVLVTDLMAKVLQRQHQEVKPFQQDLREQCQSTDQRITSACAIVKRSDWVTVCAPCRSPPAISRRQITALLQGSGPVIS